MKQRDKKSSRTKSQQDDLSPAIEEQIERDAQHLIVAVAITPDDIEALEALLAPLPATSGITFIIVPTTNRRGSLTVDAVASRTSMPVLEGADGIALEPDHVYIIPAGAPLGVEGSALGSSAAGAPRSMMPAIDLMFRSLAHEQREHAVCVVLSGAGADGSASLKMVKEQGALVIVQEPGSARFESMPRSAAATGLADAVIPLDEIAARLVEYSRYLNEIHATKGMQGLREEAADGLSKICTILQRHTGHDFSRYKRSTLVRRVQHRLHVLHETSVTSYLKRLQEEPKEVELLFKDLLIGVTRFFRDPEAFDALANDIIPKLFENKDRDTDGPVRVWVPGCASGEEAYTLAILLSEYIASTNSPVQAQIFATDIDDEALEYARMARYPESIVDMVTPERLERYFIRQASYYQVTKEIREMCIFSTHNLIKDPPFSRLDLISCRNMLIYLEHDIQKQLIPLFHYSLRSGGYLFLGPSESIAGHLELFRTVDKKHRIFQCKNAIIRPPMSFPMMEHRRMIRQSTDPQRLLAAREQNVGETLERIILDQYAPACVMINEQHEILYFSGRTGDYLEQPSGTPSTNIINMARKGLRLELRTATHKAIKLRKQVMRENVVVHAASGVQRINLIVRPMMELGEDSGLYMVIFEEVGPAKSPEQAAAEGALPKSEEPIVQQLEHELLTTREHLQATIEELETSNEELTSSNEELLSMNEEIQSANEELQTSKEELQSVNEELQSVNEELHKKVDELNRANSDLQNHFQSTQIATIFLDSDLCIKKFTPTAVDIFRLIDSDIGRPIIDIAPRFNDKNLIADIKEVLRNLATKERQVHRKDEDAWYIMRILPYRTIDNVIDGVVLTFVDITELKHAEERIIHLNHALDNRVSELETLLRVLPVAVVISDDPEGRMVRINEAGRRIFGVKPAGSGMGEMIDIDTLPVRIYRNGLLLEPGEMLTRKVAHSGEAMWRDEIRVVRSDGAEAHLIGNGSPLLDKDGKVRGVIAIFADITATIEAKLQAEERAMQQSAAAELGVYALRGAAAEEVIAKAVDIVHRTLGTDYVEVLELQPDGESLLLKGGYGWKEGYIGSMIIGMGFDSQAGYTLSSEEPVIVDDLTTEVRFRRSKLLSDHNVTSGVSVIIYGKDRPFGALGAHTSRRRRFTRDAISFLQSVANVLGTALQLQEHVAAIGQSEERYRIISELTSDYTFSYAVAADGSFSVEWITDSIARISGFEIADVASDEMMQRIAHPDDAERLASFRDTLLANSDAEIEHRIITRDGETRWLRVYARPVWDESAGRIVRLIGGGQDITERKQTEEQLENSRQELIDFIENATVGLHWVDAQGTIVWANQAELDMLGYTREEYVGRNVMDFHADREVIEDILARLHRGEMLDNYEARLRAKDGSIRHVLINSNVFTKDGLFVHTRCFTRDITQRKLFEQALHEGEERLRLAVESTGLGTWDYDLVSGSLTWSERSKEIFGLPADAEITFDSFLSRLHPDDRERIDRAVKDAIEPDGADGIDIEYRILSTDGTVHWISAKGRAFFEGDDASRRAVRLIGTILDITDSKRSEVALRRSEEQFRRAIIDAPIPIIMHAEDGEILQISTALTRLTGYTTGDIPTFNDWLRHVYGATDEHGSVEGVFSSSEETREEEFVITTKWGDKRVWSFTASAPGRLIDGRRFLVAMATDITDRKQADEERSRLLELEQHAREQAEEAQARSAFLAEASALLTASLDYQTTLFSLAKLAVPRIADYCYIFAVEADQSLQMVAHAHSDMQKAFLLERLTEHYQAPSSARDRFMWDVLRTKRTKLASGAEIAEAYEGAAAESIEIMKELDPQSMMLLPLVVRTEVIGILALALSESGREYDMLDLQLGEELARRAAAAMDNARLYREAQQANQAKDQFLAVLSHELRTPLTPALASVEALLDQELPEETRTYINLIQRNIELEARLIDDLLDLTRIIKGKLRLDIDSTDIHDLIRNVLDICSVDVASKKLLLVIDLQARHRRVRGDAARLQQVFWNIIKNAVKFTPNGGTITLRSRNEGASIVVEVTDTGIGIDEATLPVIFTAFEQGEQAVTRRFGGLGLGLAITKSLVEMHGGTLTATSKGRGQGATFTVTLTTSETEEPAGTNGVAAPSAQRAILVVEDQRESTGVVRSLLERSGYQVFTAFSADVAMKIIAEQKFDLMINGMVHTEHGGSDLLAALRAHGPVPAIAVTSGQRTAAMSDDDGDFQTTLLRPFSSRTLHDAIDRLLG